MKRRRISRTLRQVPVTVSGTDCTGQPFLQSATTVNVSSAGIHLAGIACLGSVGDMVRVQYRKRQAIYRVAWIGRRGTPLEGHAGLTDLDGGKFIFADLVPAAAVEAVGGDIDSVVSDYPPPIPLHSSEERREAERREAERRRHRRLTCAASARFRCDDSPWVEARINELSEGGCYVEMMCPFPAGSRLQLEIEILGRTLRATGEVRSSQQHFGMGVMFTEMSTDDAARLRQIVTELAGEVAPAEILPQPAWTEGKRAPLDDAVLCWFATHDSLSRAEFLRLVREHASPDAASPAAAGSGSGGEAVAAS